MNQAGIKNIILDLGNVIIDLDTDRTAKQLTALTGMKYDGYHQEVAQVFTDFETGVISEELFINKLLSKCPPRVQARDIIDAWNAMLIDIPAHRIELVHILSRRYNVYILSNTNSLHVKHFNKMLQRKFGVNSLHELPVAGVFFSHQLGCRKPDKACFEVVMQKAKIEGSESVFIDDHLDNVLGSLKSGLLSVHLPVKMDFNLDFLKNAGLVLE